MATDGEKEGRRGEEGGREGRREENSVASKQFEAPDFVAVPPFFYFLYETILLLFCSCCFLRSCSVSITCNNANKYGHDIVERIYGTYALRKQCASPCHPQAHYLKHRWQCHGVDTNGHVLLHALDTTKERHERRGRRERRGMASLYRITPKETHPLFYN